MEGKGSPEVWEKNLCGKTDIPCFKLKIAKQRKTTVAMKTACNIGYALSLKSKQIVLHWIAVTINKYQKSL
jgi:hypothetical protein